MTVDPPSAPSFYVADPADHWPPDALIAATEIAIANPTIYFVPTFTDRLPDGLGNYLAAGVVQVIDDLAFTKEELAAIGER